MKADRKLLILFVLSSFSISRGRNVRATGHAERHRNIQSVNDLMHLKGSTKKDSTTSKKTTTRGKDDDSLPIDSKKTSQGKAGKGPSTSKTSSPSTSTKGKGTTTPPPAMAPTPKKSSDKGNKKSSKKSSDEVIPSPIESPTVPAPSPVLQPIPAPSPVVSPTVPVPTPVMSPAPSGFVSEAPTLNIATIEPTLSIAPTPGGTPSELPTLDVSSNSPTPIPTSEFDTTLGLEQVAERFKPFFINSARIWDTVIVGDMPELIVDATVLNNPNLKCDPNSLPEIIDDIFICASVTPIDGPFGVLGTAGPTVARLGGPTITITVGSMNFDEADMDIQLDAGTLQGLILHEMAHVYGFGTLWALNNLAPATLPCPYNYNSKASEQYRLLSGCDASIPVETNFGGGTQCVHWDEDCFLGELMTGFSTDGLELSVLTVAALDDLGYTVDYSRADPFDKTKMSPSCVCNRRQLRGDATGNDEPLAFSYQNVGKLPSSDYSIPSSSKTKPELSEEGHRIARAHGLSILNANHEWKNANLKDEQAKTYIGDQIIVVLYLENGYKYTVMVTR